MKKLLFYASAVAVLFSSCSKDATEDIAVQSGTQVFTASVAVEEENQTRLKLEGSSFVFDVNDALGVASKENPSANIMVSTAIGGTSPAFSVRTEDYDRWLENTAVTTANPLYVYFPYEVGKSFDADGKITVNIPAAQKYEFESFYKNSVYAVGYVAEYKGADQEVALKVPHSLIKANVIGWGDMKSISLNINDKNGDPITLNGDYTVDVTEAAPVTEYFANAGTTTTIDLGFKPESLDFNKALEVNFVVPAGINLSEATLIFTDDKGDTFEVEMPVEASAGKMDMRPGLRVTVGPNVQFGLDDKFLVVDGADYTAEELFLAYAYLAQVQQAGDAAKLSAHFATVAEIINSEKPWEMDALILDSVLDFATYDKAWAEAEYKALDKVVVFDAVNDFWKDVYSWYIANGGAIESLAYNAILGLENTTIKNLNVVGDGFTAGAGLENLTLENITVKANDNAEMAGFLAPKSKITVVYGGGRPDEEMTIKDVVISTGNKVIAKGAQNLGGIYGNWDQNVNDITSAAAIAIEAQDCVNVGRLYGYIDGNVTLTLEDKYDWDASVGGMPVIGLLKNNADVTADIAVNADLKNGGVVGKVEVASVSDDYVSSVIVEGVSYWNGDIAWSVHPDMYVDAGVVVDAFTAEEFAFLVGQNGSFSNPVFLTHDIDMQCDHMVTELDALDSYLVYPEFSLWANSAAERKTVIDGMNHTVSNISIKQNVNGYMSLFGYSAEIENITVKNLEVTAPKQAVNTLGVAGLAYTGKAENVTVENAYINVANDVILNDCGIAAVFAVADINNIKDVTVKNCTIESDKAVSAGIVAGVLRLSGKTSAIEGITVEGTNSVKTAAGAMNKAKGLINTNYVAPKAYAYTAPFGIVNVTGAAFATSGTVTHTLTVSKSSYGSVFAAGYTFANAATAKKDVTLSKTAFADINEYDYVFTSNANVNNYFNNIAFDAQ